jgi:hypothetical protein
MTSYETAYTSVKLGYMDQTTAWLGVNPETSCTWVGEEETGECARDCTTGRQPGAEPVTLPDIQDATDFVEEWITSRNPQTDPGIIAAVVFGAIVAGIVFSPEIAVGAAVIAIAVALGIITEEEAQKLA